MDSFEINKVLGAVLGTCLILLAVHIASGAIFSPPVLAKPGYEVAVKEEQPAEKPKAGGGEEPFDTVLASASAQHGEQVAKQCQICHNLKEGQGPKVGPDLWNVVGRKIASVSGFDYSSALKGKSGTWTFDLLNEWLTKPSAFAPGTKMTFAGLSRENQRADLIAYLDTLSDHPVPLPKAAQKEGGAPAAQAAPAAPGAPAAAAQPNAQAPAKPNAPAAAPKAK
jgi:cytochrome c